MDFDGIVAQIKVNAGRSDAASTTNATAAANAALRAIESESNWYWMEQTQTTTLPNAGTTDRITVPSDFKEIRQDPHYIDANSERIPLDQIDENRANYEYNFSAADKGEPEAYRIWKGQLFIYPPNRDTERTLRLPYWAWSAAIAGVQTNELSVRWPDLWVARGTVEYFRILRDFKAAGEWMGDPRTARAGSYFYELAKLKRYETRRKLPRSIGVRPDSEIAAKGRLSYRRWRVQGY